MKSLFIALFLLLINSACALPVGNPSEASLFYFCCEESCEDPCCNFLDFGIGFYGDYVFNRHMETVNDKDIDTTELFTNAAYLSMTLYSRFEMFLTLGVTRLSLNTSLGAFNAIDPHPLFEIESESAFSASIGVRATLLQYRAATLGVEGQYFVTSPDIKRMYIASGAVSYPDDVLNTRYSEWQIGVGISYRYNAFFVPYAAVKYAHSYWRLNNGNRFIIESNTNTFLYNLRNQKNLGYAIGLTFYPLIYEKLAVTVEGRFSDEKALYVNGQLQF